MMKKVQDFDTLLKRMAGLCARSEQCSFDIIQKLFKAGLPREEREKMIDYLKEHRYIDDARFARSFASYKVRFAGWGKRKIRMALAAKRIESPLIDAAIDGIDEEEYQKAFDRVADSKIRETDLSSREEVARLFRHLMARGFESHLIRRKL